MRDLQDMFMRENLLVPLYKAAYQWFMEQPAEQRGQLSARIVLQPSADGQHYIICLLLMRWLPLSLAQERMKMWISTVRLFCTCKMEDYNTSVI